MKSWQSRVSPDPSPSIHRLEVLWRSFGVTVFVSGRGGPVILPFLPICTVCGQFYDDVIFAEPFSYRADPSRTRGGEIRRANYRELSSRAFSRARRCCSALLLFAIPEAGA